MTEVFLRRAITRVVTTVIADDPDVDEPNLKRPKTRREMRRDENGLSDSETEELDSAKLFTLLYTIYDNVKENTRTLKQLQQAQATQHSRCV